MFLDKYDIVAVHLDDNRARLLVEFFCQNDFYSHRFCAAYPQKIDSSVWSYYPT